MRRRRLLLVATAMFVAGCGAGTTGPHDSPRLTLTAAPAGVEGAPGASGDRLVHLTLRHEGGRAVALAGCPTPPSVRIERQEPGGAWREAGTYGVRCVAIYSSSTITLRAGGRIESVLVAGTSGRYRFVALVGPDEGAPELEVRSAAIDLP